MQDKQQAFAQALDESRTRIYSGTGDIRDDALVSATETLTRVCAQKRDQGKELIKVRKELEEMHQRLMTAIRDLDMSNSVVHRLTKGTISMVPSIDPEEERIDH